MSEVQLDPKAKKTLKIVFLTIFMDLVGFSLIFPLFPQIAKFYTTQNSQDPLLQWVFEIINRYASGVHDTEHTRIVLFGGMLGSLYSLLQFVASPFWGSLSDRFGRKKILIITVSGMTLSYVLWFFSTSFTSLVLARFFGGVMAGNLSTATACVSDVTNEKNRTRGMAFVGIAFALGFVLGPAIGGASSKVDLLILFPQLATWGLNPFSFAALVAFTFSFINLLMIVTRFEETLSPQAAGVVYRSANILKLFRPLPGKNINLVNLAYFIFISCFSGLEFTLTFLAVERFNFTPMQNAYFFVYIGFILAMIQGGFVRRNAHKIGEKKLVQIGLLLLLPGSVIISMSKSVAIFYVGLTFLSIGTSFIIPCLTSLVSFFAPADQQGKAMGTFRSLGSLGRVVGPLWASLVSWQMGTAAPYQWAMAILIIPILVLVQVKENQSKS